MAKRLFLLAPTWFFFSNIITCFKASSLSRSEVITFGERVEKMPSPKATRILTLKSNANIKIRDNKLENCILTDEKLHRMNDLLGTERLEAREFAICTNL